MTEELEVRFLVETTTGTYCVSGYVLKGNIMSFTEGDGEVHNIPLEDVNRVLKESIVTADITSIVKELVPAV